MYKSISNHFMYICIYTYASGSEQKMGKGGGGGISYPIRREQVKQEVKEIIFVTDFFSP